MVNENKFMKIKKILIILKAFILIKQIILRYIIFKLFLILT